MEPKVETEGSSFLVPSLFAGSMYSVRKLFGLDRKGPEFAMIPTARRCPVTTHCWLLIGGPERLLKSPSLFDVLLGKLRIIGYVESALELALTHPPACS